MHPNRQGIAVTGPLAALDQQTGETGGRLHRSFGPRRLGVGRLEPVQPRGAGYRGTSVPAPLY